MTTPDNLALPDDLDPRVEAAAQGLRAHMAGANAAWADTTDSVRDTYRTMARAALSAADTAGPAQHDAGALAALEDALDRSAPESEGWPNTREALKYLTTAGWRMVDTRREPDEAQS